MFDDEFMNDMLLNPDLYGLEDDEEIGENSENEESEDEESEDDESEDDEE